MATDRTVALALAMRADTDAAVNGLRDVGDAARDMASDVERHTRVADSAVDRMGTMADAADDLGSRTSQAAGGLGDLGGALAMMPGPLGALGAGMEAAAPAIMGVTGAADLMNLAMTSSAVTTAKAKAAAVAHRVATIAGTAATRAQTIAQRALNVAMRANPLGLVITAVTLLVGGFVLLYKRSETFRNIVRDAGRMGRDALGWVVSKAGALVDKIKAVRDWLKDKLGAYWPTLQRVGAAAVGAVLAPFQTMKSVVDGILGVVKDIVDWVQRIDFPDMPDFGNPFSRTSSSRTLGRGATAAPAYATGGGGGVVNYIVVQGVLDGADAARTIDRLLSRRARQLGYQRA